MSTDYYATLEVDRQADERTIKQAYRRLARKYHPDINPGDQRAEARFKEINEAYQVLSDPAKRKLYDTHGHNWEAASRAGAAGGRINFDFGNVGNLGDIGSLFESLFRGTRGEAAAQPGEDLEQSLAVSFLEAYRGTSRTIQFEATDACPTCQGQGGEGTQCPECRGTGHRPKRGGGPRSACARCHGTGRLTDRVCGRCSGSGTTRASRHLEVKVPAGVKDGQRIRLSGQGGAGARGGPRGDLYLVVRVAPHPLFTREGDDLLCEIPITFPEAVLGAEIAVPTLTAEVAMKIPPGTQSGQVFRLAGKGMPRGKGSAAGGCGDQRVRVKVCVPRDPSRREVELVRELAALRTADPRAELKVR